MKNTKRNILRVLLASILIAAFFLMGGCSNKAETTTSDNLSSPASTVAAVQGEEDTEAAGENDDSDSNKSEEVNSNQEKQTTKVEEKLTCEIIISCEALLANPEALASGKRSLIPSDGIILPATKVSFEQGESVFDILARATKDNGIHMEFTKTPIYNSSYIEGINNIYEFDGGEGSGWLYSVNGVFPQRGASTYIIEANDNIHWAYSCDFGSDIGGNSLDQKDE